MALQIEQFMCGSDNFGVVVHDPATGMTASIDAPKEAPIRKVLADRGWTLTHILITHKHGDHVEGNLALKADSGCTIIGPAGEANEVPGIDETVSHGDRFDFADYEVRVIDTPGHTAGHISFFIPAAKLAFVGDTLFSLGCGRVAGGQFAEMWQSLTRLMELPDDTAVYCGHEYTAANARFALTVDGGNPALKARAEEVTRLTAAGRPTLPTMIGAEKAANPFLRAGDPAVAANIGMAGKPAADVFAALRRMKDTFKG